MGLVSSIMGRGLPKAQMLSLVMGTLYNNFVKEDITTFEQFHIAILDIFNTFNSALPGKHYDVPSRQEVEECFKKWCVLTNEGEKRQEFVNFMKASVSVNKMDDSTLITGLVTPPAAMAAKRAADTLPIVKAVPDVLFVPSATVLTLISVKLSRKIFFKKMVQPDQSRA